MTASQQGRTITSRSADAMRNAAAQLRQAADAAEQEAGWIERNTLGEDPEYLLASIASREREVKLAHTRALDGLMLATRAVTEARS